MAHLNISVSNFITQKFEQAHYPIWREQALALIEAHDLSDHITGNAPQQFISSTSETGTEADKGDLQQVNPKYTSWKKLDRTLRGWLISTMTAEAISVILGVETTRGVWLALENAYAQNSQERAYALRQ